MSQNRLLNIFIFGTRTFLGLIFFTAGMSKLMHGQFPGIIGPVWLEDELAKYGLALFARFIAYSQVIIGILLLTQRFATLGAIMLFPLIANIFVVTVSLGWRGTPYVNAVLLALNAALLVADYPKLKFLLSDNTEALSQMPLQRRAPQADVLWVVGILLIIAGLQFFPYSLFINYVLVLAGLSAFVICPLWERKLIRKLQ